MAKRRRSKAQNQTYHFKRRCDERIGAQIDRKAIQKRIKANKYDNDFYFLNRQSNRVTRYRYKHEGVWYIIPYDKNTHKVITIFEDRKQDTAPKEFIAETKENVKTTNLLERFSAWLQNFFSFLSNRSC